MKSGVERVSNEMSALLNVLDNQGALLISISIDDYHTHDVSVKSGGKKAVMERANEIIKEQGFAAEWDSPLKRGTLYYKAKLTRVDDGR